MAVEVFSNVHCLYGAGYQMTYELARKSLFLRVYLELIFSILLILNGKHLEQ